MKTPQQKKEFFNKISEGLEIDIMDYLQEDELQDIINFDELQEILENEYAFDVEIIYYYKAMDYLRENDCSLSESLEIATELGYTTENLNSELLASLHASRKKENDFFEYVAPELDKLLQ